MEWTNLDGAALGRANIKISENTLNDAHLPDMSQHWYPAVWNSTGFAALPDIGGALQGVLADALLFYNQLETVKIQA